MREDVNTIKITIENPNSLTRFHELEGRFVVVMAAYDKRDETRVRGYVSGDVYDRNELETMAYQLGLAISDTIKRTEEKTPRLKRLKTILKFIKGLLGVEI